MTSRRHWDQRRATRLPSSTYQRHAAPWWRYSSDPHAARTALTDGPLLPGLQGLLGQVTEAPPVITINDYVLDVLHQFTHLGSTITDNHSLDTEIDKRIGKAATTLARITSWVWTNLKLTMKTKMADYNAHVISIQLYGSETWTTYARQERRLNTFQLQSLRRILEISWRDKVPNAEVLVSCKSPQHVHPAQTMQTPLAWTRPPNAAWSHPHNCDSVTWWKGTRKSMTWTRSSGKTWLPTVKWKGGGCHNN